jgi:hypothetical protein
VFVFSSGIVSAEHDDAVPGFVTRSTASAGGSVAPGPDGRRLYFEEAGALRRVTVNETGALAVGARYTPTHDVLASHERMAVSADGRNLYHVSSDGLVALDLDPATGDPAGERLHATPASLAFGDALFLPPDGLHVYVFDASSRLVEIPRDPATGDLSTAAHHVYVPEDAVAFGAPFGASVTPGSGFVVFGDGLSFITYRRDVRTEAPDLRSPTGGPITGPVEIAYELPETPLAGSVTVTLRGVETFTLQLADLASHGAGETAFLWNPADATAASEVVSASPPVTAIPEGRYDLTLAYRDALGNPPASASIGAVEIDVVTAPPVLDAPVPGASVGWTLELAFAVPEAMTPGSLAVSFTSDDAEYVVTLEDRAPGDAVLTWDLRALVASPGVAATEIGRLPDGVYTVTLAYRDDHGNPPATDLATGVVVDAADADGVRDASRRPTSGRHVGRPRNPGGEEGCGRRRGNLSSCSSSPTLLVSRYEREGARRLREGKIPGRQETAPAPRARSARKIPSLPLSGSLLVSRQ